MIGLQRFRDLLDSHGADIGAWPEPERSAGRALAASSPEAQTMLREAQALDARLAAILSRGVAGASLRARIRRLAGDAPLRRRPAFALSWGIGVAAMAASVLVGFHAGTSGLLPIPFDAVSYDVIDVAALPFGPDIDPEDLQ